MSDSTSDQERFAADLEDRPDETLPAGVSLLASSTVTTTDLNGISWAPNGLALACCSEDGRVVVWNPRDDEVLADLTVVRAPAEVGESKEPERLRSVEWHPTGSQLYAIGTSSMSAWELSTGTPTSAPELLGGNAAALHPRGDVLVVAAWDSVELWDMTGAETEPLAIATESASYSVAWSPDGARFAFGTRDGLLAVHERSGSKVWSVEAHGQDVNGVAWSPDGKVVVTASNDSTIKVWTDEGEAVVTLEGHTAAVYAATFSRCGRVMAAKSMFETSLWRSDSWKLLGFIRDGSTWPGAIQFCPTSDLLASADADEHVLRVWDVDIEGLLESESGTESVQHVSAKIVLVGDSGVGKTGLGWRLAHGEFKEQASTHGQQFWVLEALSTQRPDGKNCESVLWDLAGQPDYRLIHALFIDDADLALILFDPTRENDPWQGVEYWLRALAVGAGGGCRCILVGARIDRGGPTVTEEELEEYCTRQDVDGGYVLTSALSGEGLETLLQRMSTRIPWDEATATVTTSAFRRIKTFVLGLKETDRLVVEDAELRSMLEATDPSWQFSDSEMLTAVSHLAKYGYVQILRTAAGGRRVLLKPEILNGLASSIVIEARRNVKGLGSIDEMDLRSGRYAVPELRELSPDDREVLLDAAIVLFLRHNVCIRETVGSQSILVFPELINRRKPAIEDPDLEDDLSYSISGSIGNVYAALVVLLGYTNTFTRTHQWKSQAQYEMQGGEICGFRQVAESEGRLDVILYYGAGVSTSTRLLFQGLFERILLGRRLDVVRFPVLRCGRCGYRQDRTEIVRRSTQLQRTFFCANCGLQLDLPPPERIDDGGMVVGGVDEGSDIAARRTGFEVAVARLDSYVHTLGLSPRSCFVSYAWGDPLQERWVENLARDLRKVSVDVVLDRWDNAAPGSSISRFISRIESSSTIVVIGTPQYRLKYENKVSDAGSVVAAEVDLIDLRMRGTEAEKMTVLPVLLHGDEAESFPPLLRGRVYADFRDDTQYFASLFDILLTIFSVPFDDLAVVDLRQSLRPKDERKDR